MNKLFRIWFFFNSFNSSSCYKSCVHAYLLVFVHFVFSKLYTFIPILFFFFKITVFHLSCLNDRQIFYIPYIWNEKIEMDLNIQATTQNGNEQSCKHRTNILNQTRFGLVEWRYILCKQWKIWNFTRKMLPLFFP